MCCRQGPGEWLWRYYTFRIRVFSHWSLRVETFEVTDPYSHSLAADGARTQACHLCILTTQGNSWMSYVSICLRTVMTLHALWRLANSSQPDVLRALECGM